MKDSTLSPQKGSKKNADDRTTIPTLGCGTYRLKGAECFDAVSYALEEGYRYIDTAMYYENEAVVGRAIQQSSVNRDDIFLSTKVEGELEYLGYDQFLEAAEGCLTRLGTDYLDLLLIHWWTSDADMEETIAAMDELVDAGKVHNIGVSNFSVDQLQQAMEIAETPILTNQVEYHPYWTKQEEMLRFCQANDIILTAYSPLAEGRVVDDETLEEIGQRHGKTAAQVAIRWLIQQENVVTIPMAETRSLLRENIQVFDFELSEEEMARIADLEAPFWYRQNREGGHLHQLRGIVGPMANRVVPDPILNVIG